MTIRPHHYLVGVPIRHDQVKVRDVAASLMNEYLGQTTPLSRSRLIKAGPQRIKCWSAGQDGSQRREWESEAFSVLDIENHLATKGTFVAEDFNLYEPQCLWLDAIVTVSPGFHMADEKGDALRFAIPTNLGEKFPLIPTIDREGTAFNTPLPAIHNRIADLRETLISTSNEFQQDTWFQNLRTIISESVSAIDVMLHQMYYKAKYAPLPTWTFNEERLGKRNAMRLNDKLNWVFQITGKHLCAETEFAAFKRIRTIRNHLQHYDPPCFCFTIEDAAAWLNDIQAIAKLAWRIRDACGSSISVPLIRNLIAPTVRFVPADPTRKRAPQPSDMGYKSSAWNEDST